MLYESYRKETDEIYSAIRKKSVVSMRINAYALEEVIFGKIKPTEKVPFERYVQELDLLNEKPFDIRGELLAGAVIDKDEKIINRELDYFGDLFYTFHVKCTYAHEMYDDRFNKSENICEYLRNLYPLFSEILKEEIFLKNDRINDISKNDDILFAPKNHRIAFYSNDKNQAFKKRSKC